MQACDAQNGTHSRYERQPGIDQHWQDKYRPDLRFHFTPAKLAAWYNERYDVTDIIEFDTHGMANAGVIGRPERTPRLKRCARSPGNSLAKLRLRSNTPPAKASSSHHGSSRS